MPKQQDDLALEAFSTFGDLLRYARERVHLTQRELAAQVRYHYSYISYLEKNLRIPERAVFLARFIPALGLENDTDLVERLLKLLDERQNKSPLPILADLKQPPRGGVRPLPLSLTSMLGRERETNQVRQMLERADIRLITIVGPPGVGKTRLALHLAEQAHQIFRDGSLFVDLTSINQIDLVIPAIAAALGDNKSSGQDIQTALQDQRLLIVMDNFEQVLDAAPQLPPLLSAAPQLKILATSRESLRIRGEYEFPLSPLPVSDDTILDSVAVELFIERARAIHPGFQSDEENAARIAQICRHLDGLPLAIELAAARVRTLSLPTMLEQLDHRFEWLTGAGRDLPAWRQTLWGTIQWSYALLTGPERALFNRLATFAGGWTLEAAEYVCSDDTLCARSDILQLLMQLADKSLLLVDVEQGRYSFLETLREFAIEKFSKEGEAEEVKQKHCDYFLQFARNAYPHLHNMPDEVEWLNRLEKEHHNLRAALAWVTSSPNRVGMAVELAHLIQPYWLTRSHIHEARRWLDKILSEDFQPDRTRADLFRFASDYAGMQGEYERARQLEAQALEISKALQDEDGVYYSMDGMATLAGRLGDYAQAEELLEQVLAYRRRTNDKARLNRTLNNLAMATRLSGKLERAKQLLIESIALARDTDNLDSLGHALLGLAEVHVALKEYVAAVPLQQESLAIRHKLGALQGVAYTLSSLAVSLHRLDNSVLATQLISASEAINQRLGVVISPAIAAEREKFREELRTALGVTEFEIIWSKAKGMPLQEVVDLALIDFYQKRDQ